MRIAFVFSVLGAAGLWAGEPRWGTIDYAQPAKYLAIAESLGDPAAIAAQGSRLKGESGQVLSQMAAELGLSVRKQFNTEFATYLPQARGHVLLIETHHGQPLVPIPVLEQYLPGAAKGLQHPEGRVTVGETTVVFLDFSKLLRNLAPSPERKDRAADGLPPKTP